MNWEALGAISTAIAAIGVFFAWHQIRLTKQQDATRFEDDLTREYRDLIKSISVKALLGKELDEEEYKNAKTGLYHYVDLSNEQTFLRQQKRVTPRTWNDWRQGIKSNLSRPAFKKAWSEIKEAAPDSFSELRRLEASGFKDDPADWNSATQLLNDDH